MKVKAIKEEQEEFLTFADRIKQNNFKEQDAISEISLISRGISTKSVNNFNPK